MLDAYDPDAMPGPLFRESDIEQQKRLDLVPFQSEAFHPDKLGIGFRKGQTANYLGGRRDAGALKAHYYALVTQVDACVGRLIETLEKTGQRDNTVVIFTSDHGEMLGDHGLIYKGCRFYEGGVRVPLVFNAPGRVAAGVRADGLVELLDIAPTILEMAGLEIPSHMQGRSLGGVLAGTADPDHIRKFARCEHYDANTKRNREGQPAYGTMYRDERYKCIVYHGYDLGEIYDLQEDPGEFENLWDSADHRDLKCTLIKRSFDASVLASDWGGLPNIRRGDKTL
jgi:arylsulfatase A-like enzyme